MTTDPVHISLAFIGQVDAGKSTTAGHLLYLLGAIPHRTIEKYEAETSTVGKSSFKYAWIFDKHKAERARGLTIDVSIQQLFTSKFHFTLIDTPGHRDFTKNMITGTSLADVAILMVDAELFELGMTKEGQTREHALLAFTLGVKQLIVCVNKMDMKTVGFSEVRFGEIRTEVSFYLQKVGYNPAKIPFIPISGWTGANLVEKSTSMPWHKGVTLFEALDGISVPKRPIDRPLRISLRSVDKIPGVGTVPLGRVLTGTLKPGMVVNFAPTGLSGEVHSIERHHSTVDTAVPGDIVGFKVLNVSAKQLKRGFVCSDPKNEPAKRVSSFTAQIVVLDHPNGIGVGYTPVVDCHTAHVACKFTMLKQKLDKKTGALLEDDPKKLKTGEAGIVTLQPTKPFCVEAFSECPPLGRFVVRDLRRIIAVGVIKSVQKEDTPTTETAATKFASSKK
jgi:elongation factor 1-alpha